jgi:hypothetical protein
MWRERPGIISLHGTIKNQHDLLKVKKPGMVWHPGNAVTYDRHFPALTAMVYIPYNGITEHRLRFRQVREKDHFTSDDGNDICNNNYTGKTGER